MSALRPVAALLLIAQLALIGRLDGAFYEIALFNSVAFVAALSLLFAPQINDLIAKPVTFLAIFTWAIGSTLATTSSYLTLPNVLQDLPEIFYLLFYPLAIIGISRLIAAHQKLTLLEVVDASIVGLGLSTLGTAFALQPVLPNFNGDLNQSFFALIYPIADLILVCLVVSAVVLQGYSSRGLLISLGVLIFAMTDFIFLWQSINLNYTFGSLVDFGWLLAIVVISESFWHSGVDSKRSEGISPILITISVFLSATLLALLAIAPDKFPHFILIPAIATLALAFIRMSIALSQARSIGHERILARTDELTGLPNRRRLISEIEAFEDKQGSLLLLDLDGFKPINDQHGHEVGDKVLQQAAARFNRAIPHGVLLARLGGDEFGVLIEAAPHQAVELALALRATLSYPFVIQGQEISLGVSIGLAQNHGTNDLLLRADNAMYTAKREAIGVYQL